MIEYWIWLLIIENIELNLYNLFQILQGYLWLVFWKKHELYVVLVLSVYLAKIHTSGVY